MSRDFLCAQLFCCVLALVLFFAGAPSVGLVFGHMSVAFYLAAVWAWLRYE